MKYLHIKKIFFNSYLDGGGWRWRRVWGVVVNGDGEKDLHIFKELFASISSGQFYETSENTG